MSEYEMLSAIVLELREMAGEVEGEYEKARDYEPAARYLEGQHHGLYQAIGLLLRHANAAAGIPSMSGARGV